MQPHFSNSLDYCANSHDLRAPRFSSYSILCMLCQAAKSPRRSRQKSKVLRCDRCLWPIYRGNHHHCSKQAKLQNLRAVMSENEKDIIMNENLKSKLLGRRSHAMKIRTGGRPALFTVTRGLVKQSRVTLASIRRA